MGGKGKVLSLPTWEGDHLFLERLLSGNPSFFSLKVEYEGTDWRNGSSLHKNDLQRLKIMQNIMSLVFKYVQDT